MRKYLLIFLIFIVFAKFSYADISISKAFITLTIENEKPVISKVYFEPESIYPDTDIICNGFVNNEDPNLLYFKYKWFVNGKFASESAMLKHGNFLENDVITCQLIANDKIEDSSPLNNSIIVKNTPISLTLQKGALNLIGLATTTNKIEKLSGNRLASITGFAVSEIKNDPEPVMLRFLVLSLFIIVLVSINLFYRNLSKKNIKSPM